MLLSFKLTKEKAASKIFTIFTISSARSHFKKSNRNIFKNNSSSRRNR